MFEAGAVTRQCVGLFVRHHLQSMLDAAQKSIGLAQFVAGLRINPSALAERRQHCERLAAPQFGMSAAGHELLRLHEELDLPDAAAAKLDIVAFDRDLAMATVGMNLPFHGMDVGNGPEVEIL